MIRYDMVTNYRCGTSVEELEPSDDGEWVLHSDALCEVARLTAERDALRALLGRCKEELTCRNGFGHYCPNCGNSGDEDLRRDIERALGGEK